MLVVVEPSLRSLSTGREIAALAREMGVGKVLAVANKVATERQEELIRRGLSEVETPLALAAVVHDHEGLREADLTGEAVHRACPELLEEMKALLDVVGEADDGADHVTSGS